MFLKVSERQSCSAEGEAEDSLVRYVGLVTRFSPPSIHDSSKYFENVSPRITVATGQEAMPPEQQLTALQLGFENGSNLISPALVH